MAYILGVWSGISGFLYVFSGFGIFLVEKIETKEKYDLFCGYDAGFFLCGGEAC